MVRVGAAVFATVMLWPGAETYASPCAQITHDHAGWSRVLAKSVRNGKVAYAELNKDRKSHLDGHGT